MTIREQTEALEAGTLSEYACLSIRSKGRARQEKECDIRTVFQRDRDRILHCNSFRRLKHKTQVFLAPLGDHYRTRLTHTLEVSQIARTIARALRLNEDLTEAIALGHDLGHTPFGHAGERALNALCPHNFSHALQSVRVVEFLEKNGKGLNLTYEVKNGIACHTNGEAQTLEGRIVKISDKIAYINHDIEDAIRAGILSPTDIPWNCATVLGRNKSSRISTMVHSIIAHTKDQVEMDEQVLKAHLQLHQFMFDNVYINSKAKAEEGKAEWVVQQMYRYFVDHPDKLPPFYRTIADSTDPERASCDYIAGMSDDYLLALYQDIFLPRSWDVKHPDDSLER